MWRSGNITWPERVSSREPVTAPDRGETHRQLAAAPAATITVSAAARSAVLRRASADLTPATARATGTEGIDCGPRDDAARRAAADARRFGRVSGWIGGGRDFGDEPVPALWNRLNEARMLRVVADRAAQLGNGTREHVFRDECSGPDDPEQAVLGAEFPRMLRQAHQHLHDLGLQTHGAVRPRQAVQGRLDEPIADAESGHCSGHHMRGTLQARGGRMLAQHRE
jgi:hypothetical protein